jgi:putative nucleotidyltransferase with HDIG domain
MKGLPISREEALTLIEKNNKDMPDMYHYLESEAIMGGLARRLGEDEAYWKMLGLLHDIDWGMTKHNSKEHLTRAPEILMAAGFDDNFIQIVLSHGYGWDCAGLQDKTRTRKVEHALSCAETVTGLIHAYALLRNGLDGMRVKGVKKRMKDKRFAAAINRDIIMECENLGLNLDEFLDISIKAMQSIAEDIGF